jgi:hypothetical protein
MQHVHVLATASLRPLESQERRDWYERIGRIRVKEVRVDALQRSATIAGILQIDLSEHEDRQIR